MEKTVSVAGPAEDFEGRPIVPQWANAGGAGAGRVLYFSQNSYVCGRKED
jgi:hypothetical protein